MEWWTKEEHKIFISGAVFHKLRAAFNCYKQNSPTQAFLIYCAHGLAPEKVHRLQII